MTKHLLRDIDDLRQQVLSLGSMVASAIAKATTALLERREDLASEVLAGDDEIDVKEVLIEEECLKILALHQPVASDLRYIVTVLKVNNDLERMGDLAGNIATRAQELLAYDPVPVPSEFPMMIGTVRQMVHDALDSLVRSDVVAARGVLAADAVVNRVHRQMFQAMQDLAKRAPEQMDGPISVLSVSRCLERIADQCTNIAEDVIFLVEGEIVRHRRVR